MIPISGSEKLALKMGTDSGPFTKICIVFYLGTQFWGQVLAPKVGIPTLGKVRILT